ncbi:hypothetical protein NDN08_001990 [Rhodosorus marinus]|uniref:Methyltransferase type 11 domain-containing protein n=1 Tax=Rhodosorus marinus TaxID=101924 RepID=A0AAV8UWK5_9RHOD|nr:hypothetical protein NDN08_001990 [Rhodosorus marinus]
MSVVVFDRDAKRWHKVLSASADGASKFDYLRDEVAERVMDRLEDVNRNFTRALDLGCGRAHVSIAAKKLLQKDKVRSLLQVDQAGPIIDAAKRRCDEEGVHQKAFDVVDEEKIPFKKEEFDLVISSLALHWVNDLPGSMVQINNILRPDGLFVGSMFGGDTLSELRISMQLAEEEIWSGLSNHISPFVRLRDAGSVLGRGGFVLTTIDIEDIQVEFRDIFSLMRHLKGMGENNALIKRRTYFGNRAFKRADEIYKEKFGSEDGGIIATFQIIYMLGWKYADSQPQPLRRGSATASFKDLEGMSEVVDSKR